MTDPVAKMSIYDRMLAILEGRKPDRYPFIGRLELWQRGLQYTNSLPEKYKDMDLTDIHRDVGYGRHKLRNAFQIKYNRMEVVVYFQGEEVYRESDPVLDRFPDVRQFIPDAIGDTHVDFITPKGTLCVEFSALDSMLATGARAYMTKHPITSEEDYAIAEFIIENSELIPEFDAIYETQVEFGADGWAVPGLERIGFQQMLIDFIDTSDFFFVLHDQPTQVDRLIKLLDEQLTQAVRMLIDLDAPYVEIGDNVDGMMTNPRLFEKYSMGIYQQLSDIVHGQGKLIGSHMDGELQPILHLLPECGLDVIESFSPVPLTSMTIENTLDIWGDKPIFWGGIASTMLEAETPEEEFERYIADLLHTLNGRRAILNVVDMVLPINQIERVRRIVEMVEDYEL